MSPNNGQMQKTVREELQALRSELDTAFKSAGAQWTDTLDHIWSFGPKRYGPNLLVNQVDGYCRPSVWSVLEETEQGEIRPNDSSMVAGFQLATQAGPLCEEPMQGVCFIIEHWGDACSRTVHTSSDTQTAVKDTGERTMENCGVEGESCESRTVLATSGSRENSPLSHSGENNAVDDGDVNASDAKEGDIGSVEDGWGKKRGRNVFGPMSGQLMSVVKDGCRKAFQTMPQRLMVAMYHCAIQADTDILGEYGVLASMLYRWASLACLGRDFSVLVCWENLVRV